ncbi:MAG: glycosyltransferase family 2 protein [Pseudomonadales bacterium]|jgi:cellulose synthase/poly-beta-1,6-N-acetylglucosamine synthase-like glycosyltransferase|nr:glycosyltransferase family 2 protein [Pseudomonadales bacterium]
MGLLRNYVIRHPRRSQRFLEILPGFFSWSLILFPVWGSFFIPEIVAYYVIVFTIYWIYRSFVMSGLAIMSHFRIKKASAYDWVGDLQKDFPREYKKIHHLIIIPTYKEPITTLERTLNNLAKQTFPLKNIHIMVSFEEREGKDAKEKSKQLLEKYKNTFGNFWTTFHPDIEGEIKGKSSNTCWGAKMGKKKLVDQQKIPVENITITSEDADVIFHKSYFAYLTYEFLSVDTPYNHIWQGGIVFYNNVWKVPAPIRVMGATLSVSQMYILMRKDRLINFSTYSTSLKHVVDIGFWDTDVIPEDYRLFFKSYFAKKGEFSARPIFLPIYADMPESDTWWSTMKNQYEQLKRWAWGVSDDAYIIRQFIIHKEIPFWDRLMRVIKTIQDHFLWPVNWFALTVSGFLPPLLNQEFNRTTLGKTLPQVTSALLTVALISMIIIIVLDAINRPKRPAHHNFLSYILQPLEFVLGPIVAFFFTALPGIDAHTRLMFGKYLEYKVTEKK